MQVQEFEKRGQGRQLLGLTMLADELADLKNQFPEFRDQVVRWHERRGSRGTGIMINVVAPPALDVDAQQFFHEAYALEPTLSPILAGKATYLMLLDADTGDPRLEVKLPLASAPRSAERVVGRDADSVPTEKDRRVMQLFMELMAGVEPMLEPPEIPAAKLKSAEQHFLFLKPGEQLLGLVDETVSGTCKDGYAFTTRRIYWRPAFMDAESVAYEDLRGPFQIKGLIGKRLELGGKLAVDVAGSLDVAQHAVTFLNELLRDPKLGLKPREFSHA